MTQALWLCGEESGREKSEACYGSNQPSRNKEKSGGSGAQLRNGGGKVRGAGGRGGVGDTLEGSSRSALK